MFLLEYLIRIRFVCYFAQSAHWRLMCQYEIPFFLISYLEIIRFAIRDHLMCHCAAFHCAAAFRSFSIYRNLNLKTCRHQIFCTIINTFLTAFSFFFFAKFYVQSTSCGLESDSWSMPFELLQSFSSVSTLTGIVGLQDNVSYERWALFREISLLDIRCQMLCRIPAHQPDKANC